MKWIKRVTIQNFQSHKHTVVDFSEGMNAIVGPTDNGKSATLRAIKWCLYNKPSGFDFLRKGAGTCQVSVEFSDGTIITRTRSRSKNCYDLHVPGKGDLHFEGFGAKVPQEIIDAHGMRLVNIDRKPCSLNYAEQLDGPYLLQESPETRAAFIGSVARVEVLDAAIKDLSSDIRSAQRDAGKLNETAMSLKNSIEAFNNLDNLKQVIDEITRMIYELEQKQNKYLKAQEIFSKLNSAIQRKQVLTQTIKEYEIFNTLSDDIESILRRLRSYLILIDIQSKISSEMKRKELTETYLNKYYICNELADLTDQLKQKIENYNVIRNKISALQHAYDERSMQQKIADQYKDIDKISYILDECQAKLFTYNKVRDVYSKMSKEIQRRKVGTKVTANIKQNLDSDIEKYQKAVIAFGKCPVCFNDVNTPEAIKRIHDHLL